MIDALWDNDNDPIGSPSGWRGGVIDPSFGV